MTPLRIVVPGAAGRMGRMLIKAVSEAEGCVITGALERPGSPALGEDAGVLAGLPAIGIAISDDPQAAMANADAILDFTIPDATLSFADAAAKAQIVHVIGTTGLGEGHFERLRAASRQTVIIQSGNMSLGVNILAALVQQAARALDPSFDIEIIEMHHRRKVDAPSGTALLLGEAAAAGRDISLSDHSVRVRDGHTGARAVGDIGFATLRGGTVIGDHTVMFAGNGERIELRHIAEDRSLFAAGAIRAALWGRGRQPGYYTMKDVLGLSG
jgi:4-hydroxy-tetrahydrodipicolinate reductase